MDSNLVKRIAFAAVAIPVAIALVWYGGWPLAGLVSLVAVLGVRELFDLARKQGNRPLEGAGILHAVLAPLAVYASLTLTALGAFVLRFWPMIPGLIVVGWLVDLTATRKATDRPLASIAITAFALLYAAWLPTYLLMIRHADHGLASWAGTAMVFFPLVVVWVCDSAAMFGGKAFGGPKLAPTISPGKTQSGAIAGMIGGALVAPVFVLFVFPRVGVDVPLPWAIMMALVISFVGQVGDLAESLFKREAGVKDSSNLIPGHGGVLDRFDALYVTLPLAALCYQLMGLL